MWHCQREDAAVHKAPPFVNAGAISARPVVPGLRAAKSPEPMNTTPFALRDLPVMVGFVPTIHVFAG